MTVSRRRFLKHSGAIGAAAATATLVQPQETPAAPHHSTLPATPAATTLAETTALPPLVVIALNRMGYGPRPGDIAAFNALGADPNAQFQAYVDQQLNPDAIDDSACDARLVAARLKIKYGAAPYTPPDGRHEALPLDTLTQGLAELWPRARGRAPYTNFSERTRPWLEVRVVAWLRAIYSKRQLKELLVEFWHNHFNVNVNTAAEISATFPIYDRLIRTNCLGNFRVMLEEVAKSPAMMYYLNNVSNKTGGGEGGNENYSRELFELHTLGSDNYLKFYNDRRNIGTITYNDKVYARGYIDDDVYETARCLSGWTIGNGHYEHPTPDDGSFVFLDKWHDFNQKVVLSVDGVSNFPRNRGIEEGRQVFDLLAGHPGTARFVCFKLCRRLIADDPPGAVVDAAVKVWMDNVDAPDQLKQVVRTILLSKEFKTTWGKKFKRPFEALAGYLRATNAEMPVDFVDPGDAGKGALWDSFFWNVGFTGHRIFEWATPTGHPDLASYWTNTNGMLRRWNLPYIITQSWGGSVQINLRQQTDANVPNGSCIQIVDFWISQLCGFSINPAVRQELIDFMAQKSQGGDPTQPPLPMNGEQDSAELITVRLNAMVQLLAASADYQYR